ncbi:LuxR family transcriptional regulator [Aureibaculum marinum]|uniref:LuxR family transcriptional regulator n=1 Tax=Aureibaculum marinum TaxID=2487930 RepID=A0A3N4NLR4_9FLAO|nr:LuxR C-terminal-related transcriptional regulator [Aureibaculum marinum]RPD96475.1 LuxR family transcriptional regulator [Aureibaculum marinum]
MKVFKLLLILLIPCALFCQETPPILKFSSNTYQAENQNWAVSQNSDNFIFVANNEGLLEFNGANWTLYPSPNQTIIRSLLAVKDLIFTGAYMEFGFWKRNKRGLLEYTSLSKNIKSELLEDENIWNIKSYDSWIIFQSYDRLYFYNTDNEELNYFTDKGNYYRIFEINNVIYIHKHDGKIYRLETGKEEEVATIPEQFGVKFVLNIFDNGDELILLTRNKGFFKIKNGILTKWNVVANDILKEYQIYSGIQLLDKTFMLGTISAGIIHLSPEGNFLNTINQSNGLSNNTILNLFEDATGNVWAALDNGIDCLNMQSFIREYNDNGGTVGTTYSSIIYEGTLYVGTNQGLFYKSAQVNEPLKLVAGTKGQVWSLFIYDNDLLCGHTSGTFLIRGDQSEQISDIAGTWNFRVLPNHPNVLLQGHYSGMSLLEKTNQKWKLKYKIKGFENSARFFEVLNDSEVWVNHEYKGVYKLQLDEELTEFSKVVLFTDVPKGKGSGILKYDNKLLYSYQKGVYKLDLKTEKFVKDTALSKLINSEDYISGKLVKDNKQRLWSFNKSNIYYAEKGPIPGNLSIKSIPIQNYLRKTTVSFENITHLKDNLYIIGKTNGYILVDLDKLSRSSHQIYLNKIRVTRKDSLYNALLKDKGIFKYNQDIIQFGFSTPRYNKYEFINYQYKLDDYQEAWSDWNTLPVANFENLPFGKYTLNVRSKIGDQISSNIVQYTFEVDRPYYLSNVAILGYLLLLVIFGFVTHRLYKSYYKRQHLELIKQNQKQLEINRISNEQELIRLKNEKLNQEIESKNRELAISTMSIVKRNEVLRKIKKELKSNVGISNNNSVFKLIDKNLESTKDWNLFKDAFNSADKDFLKRAKSLYPNLTHNDLKFCAYLRLNLSSKEIAPLLNISVKSVEVRRYRLRKKMKLKHNVNLTDHILTI